jgi:hypothetical protein
MTKDEYAKELRRRRQDWVDLAELIRSTPISGGEQHGRETRDTTPEELADIERVISQIDRILAKYSTPRQPA